jgi:hypothetical protein
MDQQQFAVAELEPRRQLDEFAVALGHQPRQTLRPRPKQRPLPRV